MAPRRDGPWPEADGRLISLYVGGLSAERAALAMGLTKGAVIGRLFRLQQQGLLPPRKRRPDRRAFTPLSPDAEALRRNKIREALLDRFARRRQEPPAVTAEPTPAPVRGPVTLPPLASTAPSKPPSPASSTSLAGWPDRPSPTCCWPMGDPGTPSFRFCGEASAPGRPYCGEHARRAYLRRQPDRAEPA